MDLISVQIPIFCTDSIRYAQACTSYGCFILRATRLSNKLLEQGYVKERMKSSLRKFYGRYGDFIRQYEVSLSQILNYILWHDHIQWQPPTDQTLYRTRPFTEFWVVSIEHLRRAWHADRGCLLLRTPGPVPSLWDLHMFYLLRPILFWTYRYVTGLCSSNIPRYFLDFAWWTWYITNFIETGLTSFCGAVPMTDFNVKCFCQPNTLRSPFVPILTI